MSAQNHDCGGLPLCDRDPGEIAAGAALILWGFRHRATLMRQDKPADAHYHAAFIRNGVASAAYTLEALTWIIGTTALRPVDVRCVACPEISADEAALLDACARAADGDGSAAALAAFLPATSARFARSYAIGIASILREAGFAWNAVGRAWVPGKRLAPESGI
jgi:hypothetical protein